MIEVTVRQIKSNLSKYLNRAVYGHERVVVSRRGKPKAVIMSLEELEQLERLTTKDRQLRNQRLLGLLRTRPDDDKDAQWWADFEQELAENRLQFREHEL